MGLAQNDCVVVEVVEGVTWSRGCLHGRYTSFAHKHANILLCILSLSTLHLYPPGRPARLLFEGNVHLWLHRDLAYRHCGASTDCSCIATAIASIGSRTAFFPCTRGHVWLAITIAIAIEVVDGSGGLRATHCPGTESLGEGRGAGALVQHLALPASRLCLEGANVRQASGA